MTVMIYKYAKRMMLSQIWNLIAKSELLYSCAA